jgi:hypothetical protein
MIVEGEDEHGIMVSGPPGMRRTVVLPKFADGTGLPAAARFGSPFGRGNLLGEVLADVGGDGGAGAVEVVAACQFVREKGEVERLAVREELPEELMNGLGPCRSVVAARGVELEAGAVVQPLVAQLIQAGGADQQPLGGGGSVEGAVIEGGEDFLNEEGGNTVCELLFFIGARVTNWGRCPQAPEVYRLEALVELGGRKEAASARAKAAHHSTEGLPTPLRLRFRRALSCVGARLRYRPGWGWEQGESGNSKRIQILIRQFF